MYLGGARNRRGDPRDWAALFVALLRAARPRVAGDNVLADPGQVLAAWAGFRAWRGDPFVRRSVRRACSGATLNAPELRLLGAPKEHPLERAR